MLEVFETEIFLRKMFFIDIPHIFIDINNNGKFLIFLKVYQIFKKKINKSRRNFIL